MRKLIVFNQVTLDGYFAGPNGDLSWAHRAAPDPEWKAFVEANASSGGLLLFGRITYEMMASYWPTPQAAANDPVVAQGINQLPKVVFSRTLTRPTWANTRVVKTDPAAEIQRLKSEPGPDMVIMGSGTIVSRLAPTGLIDEYQLVVFPVVLGKGRTMFDGIPHSLSLKPASTRTFGNGNVLLCYVPAPPSPAP